MMNEDIGIDVAGHDLPSPAAGDEALTPTELFPPAGGWDYRGLVENSPDIVARFDRHGRFVYANAESVRVCGRSAEELLGRSHGDLGCPEEAVALYQACIRRVFATGSPLRTEVAVAGAKGSLVLDWRLSPEFAADGTVKTVLSIARDITPLARELAELRRREAEYREMFDKAAIGIFRLSPDGQVLWANPALLAMLGFDTDRQLADSLGEVTRQLCAHLLVTDVPYVATATRDLSGQLEAAYRRSDGDIIVVNLHWRVVPDAEGRVRYLEGFVEDVTQRKRAEEALRYHSFHDALTGLYNRAYFEEEMARLEGSRMYPITIISTDLDGLKIVNDTLGHRAGDQVLRAYADVLRGCFRKSDVIARVGGDEFALILPHTDPASAESMCQRLRGEIAQRNRTHHDLPLSVSCGWETSPGPELPLEEGLRRADKSMYVDKLLRTSAGNQDLIRALLGLLAAKDFSEQGHLTRVRQLAAQLGEAMRLSPAELTDLLLLAEVHDLGKVGIPDEILFKEGPLTEAEIRHLRQHSALGYRVARLSTEHVHIAELILYHHERWDGQGYPTGLRGGQIPLACRALALIDAYDAMVSDRPYRKALSVERAVAELRAQAGSQFDPALVELLIAIVSPGG